MKKQEHREPRGTRRAQRRRRAEDAPKPIVETAGSPPGSIAPAAGSTVGVAEAEKPGGELRPPAMTVSVATAARLLGVSRRTVQCMLEDGRLKGWRLRPRGWWHVHRESLARLGVAPVV